MALSKFKKTPTNGDSNTKKQKQESRIYHAQDLIPVKDIRNGMILTTDGRYIMIMEVMPSNYVQLGAQDRNAIIASFDRIFKIAPSKVQFKTLTEYVDVESMVQNVREHNKDNKDPKIQYAVEDYINTLSGLNHKQGITKKYYIIFQYEPGNEAKTNKIDEIQDIMLNIYGGIERILNNSTGNMVVRHHNENLFLLETLYRFYNRKSRDTENYLSRFNRIRDDRTQYYKSLNKPLPPKADIVDAIAPRGIDFERNKDFFCMDGVYYTYLAITDRGYPTGRVRAGWINGLLDYGVGVDVDFYIKKMPHDFTRYRIEKTASLKRITANEHIGNRAKYTDLMQDVENSMAIAERLREGEDIYECVLIVTIWGRDPELVMKRRREIRTDLASREVKTEYSHLDCVNYLKMTAPLLDLQPKIMARDSHNFLTSTLASIYNMTSFQLFDETGYSMGYNLENGSVVSINNYNTKMFKNGNMLIIGTSGAGKSFTEMYIGRKQFLTGIGTYYILPVKGHEYKDACESLNGQYVMLVPGSKDCINIMELRPESSYKVSAGDDTEFDMDVRNEQSQSLLAKKIASLSVWIQLLLTEGDAKISSVELNKFNNALAGVYKRYGITDDNDSIFEPDGSLKKMPIISDLYDALNNDPDLQRLSAVLLPFISGSCQNMNNQTNVDLRNRCIVFNVDEAIVGDDLLASFLYLAFDCAYDLVKADKDNFDTIVLDEVWKMMKNAACAKQVQRLVKLIRGYAGSVLIATQEINDFINDPGGFGISVINNTEIKFLMQLKDDESKRIAALMNLPEYDRQRLKAFDRGCGMLLANDKKVLVTIKASEYEESIFTTDLNIKRMFQEKRRRRMQGLEE